MVEGKGEILEGKKDGLWEWCDKNGKLKSKDHYKDGKLDGLSEYYDENGELEKRETYKERILIK